MNSRLGVVPLSMRGEFTQLLATRLTYPLFSPFVRSLLILPFLLLRPSSLCRSAHDDGLDSNAVVDNGEAGRQKKPAQRASLRHARMSEVRKSPAPKMDSDFRTRSERGLLGWRTDLALLD